MEIIRKENENKFNDYRDIHEEEMEIYVNEKLSKFSMHQLLKRIQLTDLLMDFDATSLYRSAMWYEKSIHARNETGYTYTKNKNDELVQKLNSGNFIQGSDVWKLKYYIPENLIVQHVPDKENVNEIEVDRMRKGYIVNVLKSVDFKRTLK